MKIKTGDSVRVMTGKNKGVVGKVLQTLPKEGMVVVEGVRPSVRHLKPKGQQAGTKGQRVTYNAPIPAANVVVVGAKSHGRVGYKVTEGGKKVRILKTKNGIEELGS